MMRACIFILVIIANNAFAQNLVKLSGRIQHPLSDSISISYNDNWIAYYPKEYFARVDTKGNFSLTFPVPTGIYVQVEIKHGNSLADLVLQSGDSLIMSVNTAHFDSSIHYNGRGSEVQNFIARHTLERGRVNQYPSKVKASIYKEPADFLKDIENEKNIETDYLNNHKARLSSSFIKYWNAYYQYFNYFFIEQYPQVHEIVKLRRYTDTIPAANYTVVKELPYSFNDSLLQIPPYLLYLTDIVDTKLKAAGYSYTGKDKHKVEEFQDSVLAITCALFPDKSAEYFAGQNLYGRIRNQPLRRTQLQFNDFKQRWPNSQYLGVISKQINMAEKLAPGQPAPDIDITGADGKTRKLSDLKGTVVYLGFWAGWCRQCVGEMINERKVKDVIRNRPLTFVYVSTNTDTEMDRAILNKYKIDGYFTNVKNGWYADALRQYGVQSLPAYFLIDQNGNFALQNPPTPAQSTELILAIEQLYK